MILIARIFFIFFYCTIVSILGSIYCLFNLRNPKHVATFGHIFGKLAPFLGLKVEIRKPKKDNSFANAVYIANHQNNYDIVIASNIIQKLTVTLGKKSLLWIPFFGQLYWLTGNILIDRSNPIKARNSIIKLINLLKKRYISVWIFPEGTRNYGNNLLPFRIGAFYVAITAGVPIIPICISNVSNKINLNRLNNGIVIVEMLSPIDTSQYKKNQAKDLATYCRNLMITKICELNKEVKEKEYL